MTMAAAQLGMIGAADAQPRETKPAAVPTIKPGTHTSFGALQQIEAGVLHVGYAEAGPADGPAVILLHGWPYDIHTYVDVAPVLASAGYRVIVPYLRGYGTTRFRSPATPRNGQQSVLAVDIIALMDALHIEQAILAGCDWGARTANILAALWPERCKALVSVSGYLIGSREINQRPLPPKAELAWWYQCYFATARGRAGYEQYRRDFAKLIWQLASPQWDFDEATFDRSAAAFDHPDHVSIVMHHYRWRPGSGRRRAAIRRPGTAAGPRAGHRRAHHHPGRGCQWGAAPGRPCVCQAILGRICAPGDHGRCRAQSAARSAAGLRPSGRRR